MSYTETGPRVAGPTSNQTCSQTRKEGGGFYLGGIAVRSAVGFQFLLLLFALLPLLLLLVELPLDLGCNFGRLRGSGEKMAMKVRCGLTGVGHV